MGNYSLLQKRPTGHCYVDQIKSLMSLAHDELLTKHNPFRGLKFWIPKVDSEDYGPFEQRELKGLSFNTEYQQLRHTRVRAECAPAGQQKGFTLIEMAIVLVIFVIIIIALLTARDLVLAARLRATATQYSQFNTAVSTFYNKYNALPGDIMASSAEAFGLGYATGAPGQGDGDGIIGGQASTATAEGILFWSDLFQSGLIPTTYALNLVPNGGLWTVADVSTGASVSEALPAAKMSNGNFWWVGQYSDGFHYFVLDTVTTFAANTTATGVVAGAGLTSQQAFSLDTKVDDGVPNTGGVQSIGSSVSSTVGFGEQGSSPSCINAAGNAYGSKTYSAAFVCQLRMVFNGL